MSGDICGGGLRRLGGVLVTIVLAGLQSAAWAADDTLIAAAKKEGQLTWYTTQIVDQFAKPAAEAFQKKYGIRVAYIRSDSVDMTLRLISEGKAGRVQADVFDGTSALPAVKKEGLVVQWIPESAKRFPREFWDQEGYWVATNLYIMTPSFNTQLVPKGSEPKTWADLLDPKWKGQLAWPTHSTPSGAPGFVGLVLSELGDDKGKAYLQELAKQNIRPLGGSARSVVDQVIQGEYPIALQTFNHQPYISARKGAPVDWIALNPAMGVLSVIGLAKGGANPNAAKLFIEFLVSKEGQELFRTAGYIPVDPEVPPTEPRLRPDGKVFRAHYFTPEEIDKAMPNWVATFKSMFR